MAERTVAVRLLAITSPFVAGMQRARVAASQVAAQTTAMSTGLKQTGASMASVGAQAGLLRGGLVNPVTAAGAAVAGAAKASIDWESAWAGVTKTVDGSEQQLSALQGDLRDMATTLPATHGEIAAVAEAAGQLGVETENVSEFTRTMVDLGETTNLTAEQAATSIARITNVMGTAQGDVDNLGSALVDLGNNSATTEAEILEMAQRIAGAGATIGMTETDVLGFAAALSSVGIRAEAGGTAISRVMVEIANAVESGGESLAGFAEIAGVSADEFVTAFQEDPAAAIQTFIAGLGRIDEAGGNVFEQLDAIGLGEIRVRDALLRMAESGDVLSDSLQISSEAWEENIALTEEAERRYDTTASRIQVSWNRIKDAAIDAGAPVASVFASLAEGAADLVGFLQQADSELKSLAEGAGLEPGRGVDDDLRDFWEFLFGSEDEAEQAVDNTAKFNSEIQGLLNRLPEATEASEGFAGAQGEVAEETQAATDMLALYQQELQASTDPVFALFRQVQQVDEAQRAYNEAVDEYGKNSPEAQAASFDLAAAVAAAEQAALDGDLSFDAFSGRLAAWVEQGLLTEAEAEAIRGKVKELRGEAEDYQGPYDAHLSASGIKDAESEVRGLNRLAEDWDRTHTAHFNATVSSNIVSGSIGNLLAGRGHDGGLVTTTGIQKFHDGGVATTVPRFHEGSPRLAGDEVPAILQTGEVVLSRRDVAAMSSVFGRALPAGGGNAGMAQQAAQIVIQHMELKAVGEPFNASHVASKLEAHMARSGAA